MEAEDKAAEAASDDPATTKPEKGLRRYWELKNTKSLDGLPGLERAFDSSFMLTGYGADDTAKHILSAAIQQMMKVKPVVFDPIRDKGLFMLLIGFVAGGLVTSICHKFLA
jgi:hypothetical protein